jgi:hypothetical protein
MVFSLVASLGVFVSCSEEPAAPQIAGTGFGPTVQEPSNAPSVRAFMRDYGNNMNANLEAEGAEYRLGAVEWILSEGSADNAGIFVFFNDRGNKRLTSHWVPFDPRRGGSDLITYIVDVTDGNTASGLTTAQTTDAIDRAMRTWNEVECSPRFIYQELPMPGVDLGVVEFQNGLGGSPEWFADITHAGWLPAGVLPSNVIGVTFTFIWTSSGVPTDIDNNKRADTAFREIYYNDLFNWQLGTAVDVETIALHETGHGLSQAHFGSAFITESNNKLHFNPRALMNAAYSGVNQQVTETDLAGHCSIWASWPNN